MCEWEQWEKEEANCTVKSRRRKKYTHISREKGDTEVRTELSSVQRGHNVDGEGTGWLKGEEGEQSSRMTGDGHVQGVRLRCVYVVTSDVAW